MVGHGEKRDRSWLLDHSCVDVKYLVSALAVAGWAKEYPWECTEAHGVCSCQVVVGLNIRTKWGNAMFCKVEFASKKNFAWGVNFQNPCRSGRAVEPEYCKVDKVYNNLAGEHIVWEIKNESLAPFLDGADESFDVANVFAGGSCVDLCHVNVVLYFIIFLVHHCNFENESCTGIKPDYFSDTAIQLPSCLHWQLFDGCQP
jgi:hypothetical protein